VSKPLQIRNVPDHVLDALRVKAEGARISLAAYALMVLERDARTPSIADVLAPRGDHAKVTKQQIVDAVRAERDSH
jgi:plasmid stability protein